MLILTVVCVSFLFDLIAHNAAYQTGPFVQRWIIRILISCPTVPKSHPRNEAQKKLHQKYKMHQSPPRAALSKRISYAPHAVWLSKFCKQKNLTGWQLYKLVKLQQTAQYDFELLHYCCYYDSVVTGKRDKRACNSFTERECANSTIWVKIWN